MRILHTSDWHLGIQLHGVSLLQEQREMVSQITKIIKTHGVDAVILAGDVFDHAVARPEAIALYNDAMTAICRDCGVPVLMIAGNHDGAARLCACAALLRGAGLYVEGRLGGALEPILLGDSAFYLLPYFQSDEARYFYGSTEERPIRGADDAMRAVLDALRPRLRQDKRNILVAHAFVGGAVTCESDRAATMGGAAQISAQQFQGFDYVALGHLHRTQACGANIRYSGAPYPYSFAEAGTQKSVTLLDTKTMETEEIMLSYERELRVLRGKFEPLLAAAPWDMRRRDYLQIELTDGPPGMEKLSLLREAYENLLLLTGVDPAPMQQGASFNVRELSALTPRDLLLRFCEETTGRLPDAEELAWFEEAAQMAERGALQ